MKKKSLILTLILFGIIMSLIVIPINTSAASMPTWFRYYWRKIHRGLLQVYRNVNSITQLKKDVHRALLTALYHAGVDDGSITTAKIADEAITDSKIEFATWSGLKQGWMFWEVATLDFPSISAQDCATQSFISCYTLNGDEAIIANPYPVTGGIDELDLTWNVWVSDAAIGEITIRVCNPTSGALNPVEQSWVVTQWWNF